MEDILVDAFLKILNMSMTASYIILAVIIARFLLRRAPKKYSYALWAVALFRLVCPVSFKSVISIFALKPFDIRLEDTALSSQTAEIVHIPENIGMMAQPEIQTGIPAVNAVVNESLPAATPMYSANPMQIWEYIGMLLWVTGIVILLTVSLISLWRLCRRLRTATQLEGNVWQSEKVQSPFIIGLFRAKIYIPYGLEGAPLGYVLAHERAHLKRGDHVVRTLAYLVLCLHWFNPLVWLAFWLMGRDMELSCDEKVLGSMGDKAEYSETLLSFAAPRRFPTPTPLAFGESSVGRRIKNALKWKRPRLWVSIIALVLCVTVIAACAANPKTEDDGWELSGRWVPVECVYQSPVYSYFPFGGDNGYLYEIHEHGDGLKILDHQSGEWRGGYGPIGEWQDFPYSDSEWAEMCIRYQYSLGGSLSELYDEILYMPLVGNNTGEPIVITEAEVDCFLLGVDGELWFVSTTKDTNDKRWVSSIYALQKEEELGMASFAYPDGTSNEPGMEIEFSDGVKSIYAFCDEGSVGLYVKGELFSWADGSITVSGLDSLFWCPVQKGADYQRPQPYGIAENDRIRLVVHFDDLSSISCSIYVDYNEGIYTLRPVGKGVYLEQKGDGKALLSFDRSYAHPDSTATDIPAEVSAGSPWELLTGLINNSESTYKLMGGGFDHSERAKEQINSILEALASLSPEEVKVGRGMPYTGKLGFQIPSGEHIILGYCGDFVELQLSDPLRELYPTERGVWEIHNAALTELLAEITAVDGDYGIFGGKAEDVAGMELLLPTRTVVLGEELIASAIELLSLGKSATEVYVVDEETLGNTNYALKVNYTDGSSDLLYVDTQTDSFSRYSQSNDANGNFLRVSLVCPELWSLLKEQAGIVERDDLPMVSIGFEISDSIKGDTLEVKLGPGDTAGYSISASVGLEAGNGEEQNREYAVNFSKESLGEAMDYDFIRVGFFLDGSELYSRVFPADEILGGYLECALRSDGVFTVYSQGPNTVSFAYDAETNPSLQLDFGEYDCLELTYDGGDMLFTSDGVGWGEFIGNRAFFDNEDIYWTPMEPVDDENVPAKLADSAVVVFGLSKDGTTYGGALSIEGEDGGYTVSVQGEWPDLGMGSDGRVVVVCD